MRGLLPCLLLFAVVGVRPAAAGQPTADEFRPLFDAIREAAVAGEKASIGRLFATALTIETLEESGFFADLPEPVRRQVESGLTLGLPIALATRDVVDPFETYEIRRIRPAEKPDRFRVYVRHRHEDGLISKILWSVAKQGDTWRVYDFEDLELGISFAQLIGASTAAVLEGAEAFRTAILTILAARDAMLQGDNQGALAKLESVERDALPAAFRGLQAMMRGAILVDMGRGEEGLAELVRARELKEDAPILAYLEAIAFNNLGQHDKAFARAQAYIEALDGDPSVWVEVARAHAGRERLEDALRVLRKALEDDPDNTGALAWYVTFLPPEKKPDAVRRILAMPSLVRDIEIVFEDLKHRGEAASMRLLAEAYAAKRPEQPDAPYYLGHALRLLGDESEAPVAAFLRAMQLGATHEYADTYKDAWCDIMLERGRALEALAKATDKEYVFDYLAWDLAFGEHPDTLRALAAAAAKDLGNEDAGVAFFAAEADHLEARYEKVIERLDARRAGLRAKEAELDDRAKELMWQIEDRLVRACVRTERFDAALEIAQSIHAKDGDPRYLTIVHAVKGDTQMAVKLLAECLESGDYLPADLFEDEDMGTALEAAPYRALREEHYPAR